MKKAATIDEFLADVPDEQRAALEELRKQVRAAAREATEVIAYGLPSLRLRGKYLLSFGPAKKHLSFYPGAVLNDFKLDLSGFETTKGSIHFTPEKPIPASVVTKLVKARLAYVESRERR